MDKFIIHGGRKLRGKVRASGAKNAALPIMAASLLVDGPVVLRNVPVLRDIKSIGEILRVLGMSVERTAPTIVELETTDESKVEAPYELVSTLRASICTLGPLLARRGRARVSMPGGCIIGVRPIDLHLKGLRALGADIEVKHGYLEARAKRLKGAEIYLGGPYGSSVLGTANVMMAAVLAEGKTVIENAACEPEVQDLAHFLNRCGARIEGIGRPILVIRGVDRLHGTSYRIIPDRIEAGTFIIAGAITRSRITVTNVRARHLAAFLDKMREAGVEFLRKGNSIEVIPPRKPKAVDLITLSYPGYPTDLQAQIMAYLTCSRGISLITEKIYPDRFMHVAELSRMGADIRKEGSSAIVHGIDHLSGAPVMASDLRASAALVLAGLVAEGTTEIGRVYHIDRGYEKIEEKLNALGAKIERVWEDYPALQPGQ
jgi:UDP-N-acetylglucosamine 1-carboxyvinyltransferase